MSDEPSQHDLTDDQIVYLYERQLNRAVLWVLIGGFVCAGAGVATVYFVDTRWIGVPLGALFLLAGGMLQRALVLRVRCPACGARVLGRIHSIVQSRGIRTCPCCNAELRR